jgi:acetyl-CoA acetyltransferase
MGAGYAVDACRTPIGKIKGRAVRCAARPLVRGRAGVPGATVNRLCGSGMEALSAGARAIAAGEADVIVAGGVESMTRAPFVLPRSDEAVPRGLDVGRHPAGLAAGFPLDDGEVPADQPR